MDTERRTYEQQIREQLDAWRTQIEQLRNDPTHVIDSDHGAQTELDKIQGQLEIIELQLAEMIAEENNEGWDHLRDGLEQKLTMLRSSFADKTDDTVAV